MTSKQQSQKQSASSLSVLTSLLVVASCIFGLALVPIGMVDQVLQVEWKDANACLGQWPADVTNEIYRSLNLDMWVQQIFGLDPSHVYQNELDRKVTGWMWERSDVCKLLLFILLLRVCTALFWSFVFLPVAAISFVKGWQARQFNKGNFYFTSPFKMRLLRGSFNLLAFLMVVMFFSPIALPRYLIPLVIGLLFLFCGMFVKYLQKEL